MLKQELYSKFNALKWYFNRQTKPVKTVLIILLACVLWMSKGLFTSHSHTSKFEINGASTAHKIDRYTAQPRDIYLSTSSSIESLEEISLKSEIDARVVEILVKDGQYAPKGTKLIKLELRNKNEVLEHAKANYRRFKIEYEAAIKTYNKGFISKSDLESRSANLKSAEALLRASEDDIRNTYIVAPFDGVVDKISVRAGDYLQVTSGSSYVGKFINNKSMIAVGWVPETYLHQLKNGAKALVIIQDPYEVIESEVNFLSHIGEKATKTFRVEVPINKDDGFIPSGKISTIKLYLNTVNSHKIPSSMISLNEQGDVSVKSVENGVVKAHDISIIDEDDGFMWVTGLDDEVSLISYGHQYFKDGDKIKD